MEFKDVSLNYTVHDEAALEDISFKAEPGKVIGLIGGTGSGKTSITQLITRFYEPEEGEILIDGRDVKDYSYKITPSKYWICPPRVILILIHDQSQYLIWSSGSIHGRNH